MKLESLNNDKFKLATTEMSKLVGGKIKITPTNGGSGYPTGTTADKHYWYTGDDIVNGEFSRDFWWIGDDDVAKRDAFTPDQK